MRHLASAVVFVGMLSSCGPSEGTGTVFVEVQTDWVAGVEVGAIRVRVASQASPDVEIATEARDVAGGAEEDRRLREGFRVAEVGPLEYGDYEAVAELRDPSGGVLATRLVRFSLSEVNLSVRAVFTRSCASVSCPGAGPPELTECFAGRCVDPRCQPGETDRCPVPECSADAECGGGSVCASATCESGACFLFADTSRCAAGERCDPVQGCLPEVVMDAGPGDAGGADAGVEDASVGVDAGPGFGPNTDPDLVFWVPMDETGAFADQNLEASASSVDVRCFGGNCPVAGTDGAIGGRFAFDGVVDVLRIRNNAKLRTGSGGYTVAVWVRVPSIPTTNQVFLSLPFSTPSRQVWRLGFTDQGSGPVLSFLTQGDTTEALLEVPAFTTVGAWVHVAAVWDGASRTQRVLLDGVVAATGTGTVTPDFGMADGFAGAEVVDGRAENHFAGDLDDARLYGHALTDAEIGVLVNLGSP